MCIIKNNGTLFGCRRRRMTLRSLSGKNWIPWSVRRKVRKNINDGFIKHNWTTTHRVTLNYSIKLSNLHCSRPQTHCFWTSALKFGKINLVRAPFCTCDTTKFSRSENSWWIKNKWVQEPNIYLWLNCIYSLLE